MPVHAIATHIACPCHRPHAIVQRDGQLKLIECNARFTAANGLVARAGFDLASFVYNRIVGVPQPPLTDFRAGIRLWDPMRDLLAYRQLSQQGELTLFGWLKSIARPHTFPVFQWTDPAPALVRLRRRISKR